jgi:acyl carrier protein
VYRGGFLFGGKMELNELKAIISDQLSVKNEIKASDHLATDLGLCSFDMMAIIVKAENTCGHEINTALLKKNMTVGELLNVIDIGCKRR